MGKCLPLIIFLSSSLFLVLQTLQVVNAVGCAGSFFNGNSSYGQNRQNLFSTLRNKVITNGGFYNASLGQSPNRVYALVLCASGYNPESCSSCVEELTQETQTSCPNRMDSYIWAAGGDEGGFCLVRSSNQSTFGRLELRPRFVNASPERIDPSINLTLFIQQWEATVNRTFEAATKAETSSVPKNYSAVKAEVTEFLNVYMLMQCTPDLTSQDCKTCLGDCVTYSRKENPGRHGVMVSFPSCVFRWDIYGFNGAFDNVRVLAPPRPQTQERESSVTNKKDGKMIRTGATIGVVVAAVIIMALLAIGLAICKRTKKYQAFASGTADDDITSAGYLQFDIREIETATSNFLACNKIGQGGFGKVYKGTLPNGTDVAVKRLSRTSDQGEVEFKNEVLLVAKLQHRNLVRLLGFSLQGEEKILVYEFVPNKSLDYFLFDPTKKGQLDWTRRYNIIGGITRGLLYLHQDSRLTIIHRDIKASNILLDADMNPKIADFGMARNFRDHQTEDNTGRVVGTFGYMPPEYVTHGQFSTKSDVYSFGVLILEIVSGRKNSSFYKRDGSVCNLVTYVWRLWNTDSSLELIDPTIREIYEEDEVIRCIHIGLLCVQEHPANRPAMSTIFQMLTNSSITLTVPQPPGFFFRNRPESDLLGHGLEQDQYNTTSVPCSIDNATITTVTTR